MTKNKIELENGSNKAAAQSIRTGRSRPGPAGGQGRLGDHFGVRIGPHSAANVVDGTSIN
jgi:hypothetical protein